MNIYKKLFNIFGGAQQNNNFYFGAHISSNNLIGSAKLILEAGGNLIQIFLTLPGEKNTKERSKQELLDFKNFLIQNNMKVVVHSSYIHNLARDWDNYSWWLRNLELEIKYANFIGAIGIILHFGKRLELSLEQSFNNMYTSLIFIHNKTKEYIETPIFLETSTGQGSEICFKLEELSRFYKKFSLNKNPEIKNRIKICIDTCHVFSAGYNLKTKSDVVQFLESFEELIGLRYVKLIHLNDCLVDVGSKRDRHENIGKGYIGLTGLIHFFNYFRKLNIPIILETPDSGFRTEIDILNSNKL